MSVPFISIEKRGIHSLAFRTLFEKYTNGTIVRAFPWPEKWRSLSSRLLVFESVQTARE